MSIKKTYLPVLLCAVLLAVGLSACSSDDDSGLPSSGEKGLRFSVQGVQTRLGYDFESTTFDDDEAVGCVIASVSDGVETFVCNSKWTYRASDGMLILQADGATGLPVSTDGSDNSLLTLSGDTQTLKFCFYYPYVDNATLETALSGVSLYTDVAYPNCLTANDALPTDYSGWSSALLTGEVAASYTAAAWNSYAKYGWNEYPCFVNHTQGDPSAAGQLNDIRLQNSDFLWVASPEITASTQHTVNLTFQKKTATILVYCESQLADIYFTPGGKQSLLRGKQINLSTGELSDYTYSDANDALPQQKSMYFNAGEHIVPCYRGQSEADGQQYYFYRIVLPAQTGCRLAMHILGDFDRDEGTPDEWKDIKLSDDGGLTELKEGYLYSIRISQNGNTKISINDWNDGGLIDIEEVTD
jgi:hypothetical protein